MASLRDTVKDYQDELRDGIAWVAFWKQGRSWNAEYFHLDMDDTLYPEDRSRLEEIKSIDPAAVILNGYYCGHLGEDMSLDELTAGVRYHYENSMNDIDGFIGAHDDRLPPEVIEEARAAAHEAGLPFSEKPYRDGEDFNPYVFDGSMSIEDFELMHRMIEKERSEQMAEPILSGYLSNLGKYTEGRPAGEWVTFPTTAEHLKEVFDRIGIDFKHYEEWHFTEFQSPIPGLAEHLSEYSHPDELNYLGKLLEMQFDDDREKFIAAIEYGDHADSLQDIINLAQNLDCYWIYPSVHNEEEYGRYLVDELEEPELPEEAKKYFMYEEYGRDASINDDGMFTEKGYIYNNRNTFTEWYDGRDVPQEYRVTPQPPQRSRPDPEKVEMDAAAPGQRTAQTAEQPGAQTGTKPGARGLLARTNPVARVLALLVATTPLLITIDPVSAGVALALELALMPLSGVSARSFFLKATPLLVAAPLGALSMLLYASPGGTVYWQLGPAAISDHSMWLALGIGLRMCAIVMPAIALLDRIDPTDMGDGLAQILHLPARPVLAALAGARMTSLMAADWKALERARRARGVGDSSRIRSFLRGSFSLLVFALRRSGKLATTMEARGFGAAGKRTWARVSRLRAADAVLMIVAVALPAIALTVSVMAGTFALVGR